MTQSHQLGGDPDGVGFLVGKNFVRVQGAALDQREQQRAVHHVIVIGQIGDDQCDGPGACGGSG